MFFNLTTLHIIKNNITEGTSEKADRTHIYKIICCKYEEAAALFFETLYNVKEIHFVH
jgi:hypothetical protein